MEVDRFAETAALIREATRHRYALASSLCPPPALANIMADTDGDLAPLLDAKTGIEMPAWVSVADMPILTTSLKRAAAVLARDERTNFADAARSSSSTTKKGSKPPADAAPAVDVAPEIAEASDTFCGPILERERAILRARLQAISARAVFDAVDAQSLLAAATDRMHTAMKERFVAECESVASVVVIFAEAVCAGETLPYDLVLSDDGVVIDEGSLVVPPQSPKQSRPPSPEPLAPGLLSLRQISTLIWAAQQVTTCEFLSTRDCTDLLQGLSAEVGGRYGAAFPAEWSKATWKQMHDSLVQMDAHASCYIDWLELTVALLIHAMPVLYSVTAKALAAAAVALTAADNDGDGAVMLEEWMDCPMWFQPKPAFGDEAVTAGGFHNLFLHLHHRVLSWHSNI